MTRQRKAQPKTQGVPEIPFSQAPSKDVPEKPLIEISEEEQWRIIKQTGILNTLEEREAAPTSQIPSLIIEEPTNLGDEIFNTTLLLIPFSSLLLLMEM